MNRAIGLPIILTTPLTIGLNLEITNGVTNIQLTSADFAYVTIAADKYRWPDFLIMVDDAIRRWLFGAIAANAGLGAANVGDKDDKGLQLTLNETPGSNTALITFRITSLSATIGGIAATLRSAGVNQLQSVGAVNWANLLGLQYETELNRNISVTAGTGSVLARAQSKYIHVVERSEVDSLTKTKIHFQKSHRLDSGKVRNFKFGGEHNERQIIFVDQDFSMAQPPEKFGHIDSIAAARDIINFKSPFVGGVNVDKVYFDTKFFSEGAYVEYDGFMTRGFYAAGAFGVNSIKLMEKIPTSIVAQQGKPVRFMSDLWYIWRASLTQGSFQYYKSDDTGDLMWISDSYMPYGTTEPVIQSERRDNGVALYDIVFNLIEVEDDETAYIDINQI